MLSGAVVLVVSNALWCAEMSRNGTGLGQIWRLKKKVRLSLSQSYKGGGVAGHVQQKRQGSVCAGERPLWRGGHVQKEGEVTKPNPHRKVRWDNCFQV